MPQASACSAGSFLGSWEREKVLKLLPPLLLCKCSYRKIRLTIPQTLQPNLLSHHSMAGDHATHQPFQLSEQLIQLAQIQDSCSYPEESQV